MGYQPAWLLSRPLSDPAAPSADGARTPAATAPAPPPPPTARLGPGDLLPSCRPSLRITVARVKGGGSARAGRRLSHGRLNMLKERWFLLINHDGETDCTQEPSPPGFEDE